MGSRTLLTSTRQKLRQRNKQDKEMNRTLPDRQAHNSHPHTCTDHLSLTHTHTQTESLVIIATCLFVHYTTTLYMRQVVFFHIINKKNTQKCNRT